MALDPVTIAKLWLIVKPIRRINARRARKGKKPLFGGKEEEIMSKYNKALGAVIGGVIGLVAVRFPFISDLIPSGFADQLAVMLLSLVGTYFAPKNT